MRMNRTILFLLCLSTLLAQDTGTAHKAAATALLNSNNSGGARLACPATIRAVSTANSPGGPGRAGGPPGDGGAKGGGAAQRGGPWARCDSPERELVRRRRPGVRQPLHADHQSKQRLGGKDQPRDHLIDTLFGYAAQDAIVDGLKKVGLDPADIKYIIVSHAHGDHDGATVCARTCAFLLLKRTNLASEAGQHERI